ncbi:MAG: OmpA family protein, partial [Rhizomicrobium sp.]
NIASGHSGDTLRVPAGAYDVEVWFSNGMINKHIWLANQAVAGKVERKVELALHTAEPTVAVTQNGVDVGNTAGITYIDPASHGELGAVRSGETALLEAGTYDIHASLFGAEGWLRRAALSGKQRLTIDIKPLKTEQLRIGGPPPQACTIEVYGVNFDFNKSVLRPDSEPMLKQILALFTNAPGFSAEIGGHTDNIGTPDYNLKLSDARAAAVKAWLQAHGVAAARVASHGYGDTRPLLPNTTDENRAKNRRVELRTANCR